MKTKIFFSLFISAFNLLQNTEAQIPNCDSLVPVHYVDLTGPNAFATWTSPSTIRNGNCCTTIPPDRCELFVITTDSNTTGIILTICGGPIPSGGLWYQLDCGTPVGLGDTIFISTPGVYNLTFCKPGSVANNFCITPVGPQIPTGLAKDEIIYSTLMQDFQGNHFLNLNLDSHSSFTLNIFSVDGKIVSEKKYELNAGPHVIALPRPGLEGVYFCRVNGNGINKSWKLLKF